MQTMNDQANNQVSVRPETLKRVAQLSRWACRSADQSLFDRLRVTCAAGRCRKKCDPCCGTVLWPCHLHDRRSPRWLTHNMMGNWPTTSAALPSREKGFPD